MSNAWTSSYKQEVVTVVLISSSHSSSSSSHSSTNSYKQEVVTVVLIVVVVGVLGGCYCPYKENKKNKDKIHNLDLPDFSRHYCLLNSSTIFNCNDWIMLELKQLRKYKEYSNIYLFAYIKSNAQNCAILLYYATMCCFPFNYCL